MLSSRQLAAIMFMDIAGYTAMMGENETNALRVLEQFKNIATPLVQESGGKWLKDLGDGALCSFGSALAAVNCAIDIQQQANQKLAGKIRIGIHSGDVIFQEDDVFGDGVNIASRIQSEAAPGGICISEQVYKSVRNNDRIRIRYLGKRKLKNVEGTTGLYQLINKGLESTSTNSQRVLPLWMTLAIALGLAIPISILSVWYIGSRENSSITTAEKFDIVLPKELPLAMIGSAHFGIGQTALVLNPEGNKLIYAAQEANNTRLYIRDLNSYQLTVLEGTEGAYAPFFSPDGQWVGFFAQGYLKKVSVRGGSPFIICEARNPNGAAWAPNNRIYFSEDEGSSLKWVSEGNQPRELKVEGSNGTFGEFNYPSILGDDYLLISRGFPRGIYAIKISTGTSIKVLDTGHDVVYLPTGHLLFTDYGRLMIVPFDEETLKATGEVVPLLDDLRTEYGPGQFTISSNGTLIYVPGVSAMKSIPVIRSFDGEEEILPLPADYYGQIQVSPDGNKLVIAHQQTLHTYSYDIRSQTMNRLTKDGITFTAIWGPGENEITCNTNTKIQIVNASGATPPKELLKGTSHIFPYQWSGDGSVLMYGETSSENAADIKFYFTDQTKDDLLLTPNQGTQALAKFSPGYDHVAYTASESGIFEVYVQPFPPTGERWTVSSGGGEEPIWSPSGDLIFYRNGDTWVKVEVSTSPAFSIGQREILFKGPYNNVAGYSYDIMPDGQQFLLHKPVSDKRTADRLKVIKNWFQDLDDLSL